MGQSLQPGQSSLHGRNSDENFAPCKGPGKCSFQLHMSFKSNQFENSIFQVIGKFGLLIWESSIGKSFTLIMTRINKVLQNYNVCFSHHIGPNAF